MSITNQEAEHMVRGGVEALRGGRPADARNLFERLTATGRANIQIWLLLASACRALGDDPAEEEAIDAGLKLEPRALRAHIMKADCRRKAGDERGAINYYRSALLLAEGQRLPDDLAAEVRRAEAAMTELNDRSAARRDESLAAHGFPEGQRSERFQQALDIIAGKKRIFVQEPSAFYFPGLPQIQFYDTDQLDWVAAVEAQWRAIREEIEPVLASGREGFRPYIQTEANQPRTDDNPLLDSQDWSTLFLCDNGVISDAMIERFPKTWQAVQAAPLTRIPNSSPTVMFSLLRPGARIIPHNGVHNARLICHLPLIVPPGCGFRVGNEVREWEEGKMLIFDDSIEHEAWNEGSRDRLVLIFDIWRPEISDLERREITALFQGPKLD
jgi:aspartyl/asparaginyl beta-hydroxylase (cupin superfamily)